MIKETLSQKQILYAEKFRSGKRVVLDKYLIDFLSPLFPSGLYRISRRTSNFETFTNNINDVWTNLTQISERRINSDRNIWICLVVPQRACKRRVTDPCE